MRVFLKKMSLLLCTCVFLMESAHVCFADNLMVVEAFFSKPEEYSRFIDVPGKGLMRYYAQNDPLWAALCYERENSQQRRPFRDSGCSPSALAMAVASLVDEEKLPAIGSFARKNYSLCPCSLNQERCNKNHMRYYLTSQRDYVRFLPLVIGDFATGNNSFGIYSRGEAVGTSVNYIRYVAEVYGLSLSSTSKLSEALEAVQNGCAVVVLASKGGAFTNTGHYVFLASADEERVYILDPLYRESYKTNYASKLEIIEPGLVALTMGNVSAARFGTFYILGNE